MLLCLIYGHRWDARWNRTRGFWRRCTRCGFARGCDYHEVAA